MGRAGRTLRAAATHERAVLLSPTVRGSVEQLPEVSPRRAELIELALCGRFVGSPAEELRAVAEAASREVIELNFDDQLRRQRLPFGGIG